MRGVTTRTLRLRRSASYSTALRGSQARPAQGLGRLVRRPLVALLFALLAAYVFLTLAYRRYSGDTLMGDDLDLLVQSRTPGGYASTFWGSFLQTGADKYRPVVTPLLSIAADVFDGDYGDWIAFNTLLLSMNAVLVGVLAWRLSRRSIAVAGLAMVAVLASRFASYFVLQGFGLMESVALMCVLVTVLLVQLAWERQSAGLLAWANLPYLLGTFSHERYIVLAAFLVSAAILASWRITLAKRATLVALPIASALVNYGVKTYALEIEFFTGGGGEAATTDPFSIVRFMVAALLNTVGYNAGPSYLSGKNAVELGLTGVLVSAFLLVPLAALLLDHLVNRVERWSQMRPFLLGLSLYVPLLLSASLTFRQEYRWLYGPFVVLVLGVAWLAGQLPARAPLGLLPLVVLCGSLTVEAFYRPWLPTTYFFAGQATADSVKAVVIEPHRADLPGSAVVLVTHGDRAFQDWYMRGGAFFDVYAEGGHGPVVFVDELSALTAEAAPGLPRLVFDFRVDHVVELPSIPTGGAVPATIEPAAS